MNSTNETNTEVKTVIKKWIKKDGSITEKEYNQTAYSKKHYEKNKAKYLSKTMCPCGIEFSLSNKHNHITTRFHKLYEKMSSVDINPPPYKPTPAPYPTWLTEKRAKCNIYI